MNIIELLNKVSQTAVAPQQKTASAQTPRERLQPVELLQVMITHNHLEKTAALTLPPASWQRVVGTGAGAAIGAGAGHVGAGMFTDDKRIKLLSAILGGVGGGAVGYRIGSHYSPLLMTPEMKQSLGPAPATPAQEGLQLRRAPGAWNAMNHDSSKDGTSDADVIKQDEEGDKANIKGTQPSTAKKDNKDDKEEKVKKAAALYTEEGI